MAFSRGLSIRRFVQSVLAVAVVIGFFVSAAPAVTQAQTVSLKIEISNVLIQTVENIPWTSGMTALAAIVVVQKDKMPLQPAGGLLQTLWQFFDLNGVPQPFLYGINGINGVKIGKIGTFWRFFINGVSQPLGLGQTKLNDGDQIQLKYQSFL